MECENSTSLKQWLSSYIEIFEKNGGFIMNITELETVISLWLESKKQVVKGSAFSKYKDVAERFCSSLNKTETEEISDSLVNTYIDNLQHNLSPVSVKIAITVIEEILNFASENHLFDKPLNCTFPKISTVISETQTLTFNRPIINTIIDTTSENSRYSYRLFSFVL